MLTNSKRYTMSYIDNRLVMLRLLHGHGRAAEAIDLTSGAGFRCRSLKRTYVVGLDPSPAGSHADGPCSYNRIDLVSTSHRLGENHAMGSEVSPKKQFTVAIVGGGIGGLALAIGLLRRNVPVQIYEAAPAFRETGLGLSIGPAAHRALPRIDPKLRVTYDSLVTTNADSPGFERFRDTWFEVVWASGDEEGELMMDLKALPSGQTTLRRADFLAALVAMIPDNTAHFDKRLGSLTERADSVQLSFEDGTTVAADVVVGCDGIKSRVKEFMLPEEVEQTRPRYSGMYCYRAVLDMQDAVTAVGNHRARVATWYIGSGCYAITYPIMNGKKLNFGMYKLDEEAWDSDGWVRPGTKEDLDSDMGHMGSYVNALMKVGWPPRRRAYESKT